MQLVRAVRAALLRMLLMLLRNVRNPESLPVNLDALQSILWQVFFFQTEKGEVWQVAQYCLKPPAICQNLAHARIVKFVDVECEHRDVLRGSRRCYRIENRLGKVLAEINTAALELQHFRDLLMQRQSF